MKLSVFFHSASERDTERGKGLSRALATRLPVSSASPVVWSAMRNRTKQLLPNTFENLWSIETIVSAQLRKGCKDAVM